MNFKKLLIASILFFVVAAVSALDFDSENIVNVKISFDSNIVEAVKEHDGIKYGASSLKYFESMNFQRKILRDEEKLELLNYLEELYPRLINPITCIIGDYSSAPGCLEDENIKRTVHYIDDRDVCVMAVIYMELRDGTESKIALGPMPMLNIDGFYYTCGGKTLLMLIELLAKYNGTHFSVEEFYAEREIVPSQMKPFVPHKFGTGTNFDLELEFDTDFEYEPLDESAS